MSFSIKLQKNKSEVEKFDKDIEDVISLEGTLRESTSIMNPIITVNTDNSEVFNCNYLTIDSFNRKYFITDITSIRTGVIQITAHVDVLTTYKDQIRNCTGIVDKQEGVYNLYLDDGSLRAYNNPIVNEKVFPNGFEGESYVLLVAGSYSD